MMLLFLLMQAEYDIEVVHFNHMKRNQSAIEADLVKNYCDINHIPFHYYLIKVKEGNFHHQAHTLRMHHLKQVAKMRKSHYIFTAHHLDDLLENVLIKLTRGSNLLGYAGMQLSHQEKNIYFVKPLLYTSKADILDYVLKNKVPYLNDESNNDDQYLRNRFRHTIVPIMKQENPNLLKQAFQYHKQMSQAFNFIRKTTLNHFKESEIIDLEVFSKLDDAIQDDTIAYFLEKGKLNTSFDIVMSVKEMLLSEKPNAKYQLSGDFFFTKAYNQAFITKFQPKKEYYIEVLIGENTLTNVANFTFLNNSATHTEDLEKLCYNKLAFPLWLRHRKDGDKLSYTYGHKKIKDLLIDKKIPLDKRDELWILTDNEDQILWVQNHYINKTLGKDKCLYFKFKESKYA